ncbi:hypothetical protein H0178_32850 [Cytobacillus firmus]|jgi:hypothetical protein|nr:hypothetical protein [Cytobacillus firmus]
MRKAENRSYKERFLIYRLDVHGGYLVYLPASERINQYRMNNISIWAPPGARRHGIVNSGWLAPGLFHFGRKGDSPHHGRP